MFFLRRTGRLANVAVLCLFAFVVVATATIVAIHPVAAESALAVIRSAVSCAVTGTNSCVSGTNTSSGVGVAGSSKTGYGMYGTSTSSYGIRGTSSASYGLVGTTSTGYAAIAGTTASKIGVYGYTTASSGGTGVFGSSVGNGGFGIKGSDLTAGGTGVSGSANAGDGVYATAGSGGAAFVANATGTATGFYITTASGNGVDITAGNTGIDVTSTANNGYALKSKSTASGGTGVSGQASTGVGVAANAGDGGQALVAQATGAGTGVTVTTDTGTGLSVETNNGVGGDFSADLFPIEGTVSDDHGLPLSLYLNGSAVLNVDAGGNINTDGSVQHLSRTVDGKTVRTFGPKSTAQTVEDTGSAQLIGGTAAVRLDPIFAASIDPGVTYRVFVTPDGDMAHGLYVASKSPAGFVVREMQGGRSSVAFDYRIVGTALGKRGERIAFSAPLAGHVPSRRPAHRR